MAPRRTEISRAALGGLLLAAGAAAVLLAASSVGATARPASGVWVAAGFALCAVALGLLEAPIGGSVIALVFALYVGVSAALAIALPARDVLDGPVGLGALASARFLSLHGRPALLSGEPTRAALELGGIGGLGCLAAFLLATGTRGARAEVRMGRARLTQSANILVGLGLLGIIASAVRFVAEAAPGGITSSSIHSFWHGGAYLLLLAQLAIPGLALHLSLHLAGAAPRSRLRRSLLGFAALMIVSLPTGERGYLIECGLAVSGVFLAHRRWARRLLVPAVLAGAIVLVVTQATRDSLSRRGTLDPGVVAQYLTPSRWEHSLENQFASFQWAADVEAYGPALHAGDPLLALLQKPVPRQLDPGKPNGLSSGFTRVVYPSAAAAHVSFAIPLYAELDYAAGPVAAIGGLLLLGALLGAGFNRLRHWPHVVRPVAAVGFIWAAFVLIRGDLSSSVPLALAWLLAVGFVAWWARSRSPERVVLDALAVPPTYSGIGATVLGLGHSLDRGGAALPLVLRCAADARSVLEPAFPAGTEVHCPLPSSRPPARRLLRQLLVQPLRERRSTLVLSASELAAGWGLASRAIVCHDLRRAVEPDGIGRRERWLYRALAPWSLRRADAILTGSRVSARSIEDVLAPSAPIHVVALHHGLRVRPRGSPVARTICVLGAIRPYKGLDTLVDALERIAPERRPSIRWVGASELPPGEAGRLTGRAGRVGVELLGWKPEAEVVEILDGSAALLAPSRFEGYGLALLEGLRRGMPVIATDIPAHREVAGEAAVYFPAGDAEVLAATLTAIASGSLDLDARGDASRVRAVELAGSGRSWADSLDDVIRELSQ